jgi:predicted transcriptional regulator
MRGRSLLVNNKLQNLSPVEDISDPILLKILVLLDKVGILTSKRIAEILNISRDGPPVEKKMKKLENMGMVKATGTKRFEIGIIINLWELTETGKKFVADTRKNKKLPNIKLSEMNGELKNICSEILNFIELPKSINGLETSLNSAGIKMRKYKLIDTLRILEAAALIKKTQVRKEIKVLERIGITEISDVPGGIVTYMKTEGADINKAEI